MNVPSIYKKLSENSHVQKVLRWPFDFEVCVPYILSQKWPIFLSHELIVLAEDGSGGAYAILKSINPDISPVIYLSSEGQAGRVAQNLTEFFSVIVAIPYWRDLLKFSSGGVLEEMRKAIPFLEQEMAEEEPDIKNQKELISSSLNLPALTDPVQILFSSVKSGLSIEVSANDGFSYEGLFNTFHVSDNKSWNS